ncbi:hypothetical protein CAP31_12470 [Sulfuriferula sp. AH1]|nr:hypothetical protein CAP31_12470 [Sulfuriferula sp. AH1]
MGLLLGACALCLIKIRTYIKPGNLTFGKAILSDQVGTTTNQRIEISPVMRAGQLERYALDLQQAVRERTAHAMRSEKPDWVRCCASQQRQN